MDILKTATEWAKAESFSSAFFVIFGLALLFISLGFWQMGKTDLAKAYVIPTLVAGTLLLILGIGLLIPNQMRLASFPEAYNIDASAFVSAELGRVNKTLRDYKIAVFLLFPMIIAACSILVLFFNAPIWRAGLITAIAMLVLIMIVDTNANARLEIYKAKLHEAMQRS
ncbi:MAG: hypothetical protein ABJO09_18180 [Hyphomicrobiales bacterium]